MKNDLENIYILGCSCWFSYVGKFFSITTVDLSSMRQLKNIDDLKILVGLRLNNEVFFVACWEGHIAGSRICILYGTLETVLCDFRCLSHRFICSPAHSNSFGNTMPTCERIILISGSFWIKIDFNLTTHNVGNTRWWTLIKKKKSKQKTLAFICNLLDVKRLQCNWQDYEELKMAWKIKKKPNIK